MRVGQDLVEEILERLPVKSLLRFKLVSKTWKMMIESPHFKTKHMIHWESQEPDFLFVDDQDRLDSEGIVVSTLVLGSLESIVNFEDLQPEPKCALEISCDDLSRCCDGLVCIYGFRSYILVANPSTRWSREVPQAKLQTLVFDGCDEYEPNLLGFGKDISTGTYKLVWLYNSFEINLEGATTCEVFDFNTNTWRHVESSPYRIFYDQNPMFVDGSLHWFFHSNDGIKILSFDCHTEIFQVISQSPITQEDETRIVMCNLDNRLCVSEKKWPTQDIWTLSSSNMTWEKMYSLDLSSCHDCLISDGTWPIACPLAILKNKKLLLFDEYDDNPNLVIYNLETRSFSLCFDTISFVLVAPYSESLMSIS